MLGSVRALTCFCFFFPFFWLSLCPQTLRLTTLQPSSRPSVHHCQSMFTRTVLVAQQEQVIGTAHCSASPSSLRTCGMLLWWRAGILLYCCLNPSLVRHHKQKLQSQKLFKPWFVLYYCSTGDMLGPPLADMPLPPTSSAAHQGEHPSLPTSMPPPFPTSSSLSSSSSSSSSSSCSSSEGKEQKKSGAKKKCLYNFQDAFMETNRVVMATSASTSSVSCTATTVQSSNSPLIHLKTNTCHHFFFP